MTDPRPYSAVLAPPYTPLPVMLMSFPAVCFIGTFASDLAYWQTANMQWANFSAWLLTAGLVVAVLGVIASVIHYFTNWRVRHARATLIYALGWMAAIILSIANAFVHSRDAYTSVVPTGLALSGIVVLILLATGLSGRFMTSPSQVAVVVGERP